MHGAAVRRVEEAWGGCIPVLRGFGSTEIFLASFRVISRVRTSSDNFGSAFLISCARRILFSGSLDSKATALRVSFFGAVGFSLSVDSTDKLFRVLYHLVFQLL
jgi:hypothetical protein